MVSRVNEEQKVEMKRLREEGMTFKAIGEVFGVCDSSVQYHVLDEYRERVKERCIKYAKINYDKYKNDVEFRKRRRVYMRKYMRDKYRNDVEFKARALHNTKKYQEKIRNG